MKVDKPIIPKKDLKDGTYYKGLCRNANIAVWSEKHNAFFHWRTKWGDKFVEKIKHPDDEQVYDVFQVTEEYTPSEEEKIDVPKLP